MSRLCDGEPDLQIFGNDGWLCVKCGSPTWAKEGSDRVSTWLCKSCFDYRTKERTT